MQRYRWPCTMYLVWTSCKNEHIFSIFERATFNRTVKNFIKHTNKIWKQSTVTRRMYNITKTKMLVIIGSIWSDWPVTWCNVLLISLSLSHWFSLYGSIKNETVTGAVGYRTFLMVAITEKGLEINTCSYRGPFPARLGVRNGVWEWD